MNAKILTIVTVVAFGILLPVEVNAASPILTVLAKHKKKKPIASPRAIKQKSTSQTQKRKSKNKPRTGDSKQGHD